MFVGLKVAIALAVIGAVVGEFVGATKGLGYVIVASGQNANTTLAFAAIVLLSLMSIVLFYVLVLLEACSCPGRRRRADDRDPLNGVSHVFKSRKARSRADGIDLEVRENEFVTLVGRSGCGKSTLLRIIAGLLRRPPARSRRRTPVRGPRRDVA